MNTTLGALGSGFGMALAVALAVYAGLLVLLFRRIMPLPRDTSTPERILFKWAAQAGIGAGLGLALVLLTVMLPLMLGAYTVSSGAIADGAASGRFPPFSGVADFFGFSWLHAAWEELVFRGFVLLLSVVVIGVLAKVLVGKGIMRSVPFQTALWMNAIVLSSLLFSALHWDNPNVTPIAKANILLIGGVFAFLVFITRGLTVAVFFHFGWNAMLEMLNLPISGLNASTPWHFATLRAKDSGILTGGSFGPEASISLTFLLVVLLAACIYTFPRSLAALVNQLPGDSETAVAGGDDSSANA